ncbi:hypothetical protein [Sanguibacter sp. HDW7]|uniref:hypothetical protein n=1 Tax=Sanguibacter sp. HDW7 TaxID=2714931 RepID=UPI00140B52C7|nr:hypothetical protein [Sanguibacter sp. HDW7]QIK82652.1 hypothetical protein G7063_02730 [Sanguibacter sp. HDW7]
MIEVFAIKHISDHLRREPRNVGVIVRDDSGIESRFLGERQDGTIDGRRVQMPRDIYRRWINYYRHQIGDRKDGDIARLKARRPLEFYPDLVATLHERVDLASALEEMYPKIVSGAATTTGRTQLEIAVDRVFSQLGVMPSREVEVAGLVGGETFVCEFEYAVQGAKPWLMDRITLHGGTKVARRNVNDFAFRARAVHESTSGAELAAFVDTSQLRVAEEHLVVVEQYAAVIDLADGFAAADRVGELLQL